MLRVEVLDGEQHQPVRRSLLSAAHEVPNLPDAVDVRAELVAREVERDVGAAELPSELEFGIVEALRLVRVAVQAHAELGRHVDQGGRRGCGSLARLLHFFAAPRRVKTTSLPVPGWRSGVCARERSCQNKREK